MRSSWSGWLLGAALVMACGGDDEGDGDDASAGAGGSGFAEMNVACDPAGSGVCQNDDDCSIVQTGAVRMSSQVCGLACLQDEDPGTCATQCIVMDTMVSAECAVCYVTAVACASQRCFSDCAADPAGEACVQCQLDQGCRSDFAACSGLPA